MSLFQGMKVVDLLTMEPRLMCAVLSDELARTNQAVEALAEELRQVRASIPKDDVKYDTDGRMVES